jgi:TPR repeat protein
MTAKAACVLTVLCLACAWAEAVDPYESRQDRSYRALSGSIQRAFAVPNTAPTLTPYRSNITSSSGSSQRGSEPASNSISGRGSDSNSWGMPSRQPAFSWGPGNGSPVIDADDRRIFAARKAVGQLPTPPSANLLQITQYYMVQGVSPERARDAARTDINDYYRALQRRERDAEWQAHDAKVAARRAAVPAPPPVNPQFTAEAEAAKRRALASNSMEDARAWSQLYASHAYKGGYVDFDLAVADDVMLFAAQRGVPEAYRRVWNRFARHDPAGHVWRDKAAVEGDVVAAQAAFETYAKTLPTQLARAAALFEKVHETQSLPTVLTQNDPKHKGLGRMLAAAYLAQVLASGDRTLPPDLPRAIEWLKKLPLAVPDEWTEWGYMVNQVRVARYLTANPMAAREHQPEILAYWEDIGRQALAAKGNEISVVSAISTLYGIYTGQDRALPSAINPAKADALWAWLQPRMHLGQQLAFVVEARDWKRAALFEHLTPADKLDNRQADLLGTLWLERTDGRADPARAVAFFEKARYLFSNPVPLINAYLAAGNPAMALQTLQRGGVQDIDKWRVLLRWAQLHYRGETGPISIAEGDKMLASLRASIKPPKLADELALALEFQFEAVAGPLQARYKLINAAADNNNSPEARQALSNQHRANFEPAMPRLRELAFGGYKPAMRLWSVVTLSGDVPSTAEDAATAKHTLFLDAQGGDATAVSILAQRMYLDAQASRSAQPAGSALQPAQQAQFSEAADWLEASLKSGDDNARWPLATLYGEGLGRSKSPPKAREHLQALASSGDAEAQLALAQMNVGTAAPRAGVRP